MIIVESGGKMMNIAFAGFRHGHIFELYKMAEKTRR